MEYDGANSPVVFCHWVVSCAPEADEGLMPLPALPGMPALPLPGAILEPLPGISLPPLQAVVAVKPKRRALRLLVMTLVISGLGYLTYAKLSGVAPFA